MGVPQRCSPAGGCRARRQQGAGCGSGGAHGTRGPGPEVSKDLGTMEPLECKAGSDLRFRTIVPRGSVGWTQGAGQEMLTHLALSLDLEPPQR